MLAPPDARIATTNLMTARHGALSALTGLLAAACLSGAASADFTGMTVVDVSGDVGTPSGFETFRVYANFDSPLDQLIGILGHPVVGALRFETVAPCSSLVNAGGALAGLKAEDFAGAPVSEPWDSWVTIDHEVSAGNDTDYTPGFLGSDGVHSVIAGRAWSTADGGGWFDSDPGTSAPSNGFILIAQFTLPTGGTGFTLEGTVEYEPDGSPPTTFEFFQAQWPPAAWACPLTVEHISTSPPTDIDGSGTTDSGDLQAVLEAWGSCTPDFEIVAQVRAFGYEERYDCDCTRTGTDAEGFGSWNHTAASGADSVVRDDGMSLGGTAFLFFTGGACSDYSVAWGRVKFVLNVNVPLPFTFVADVYPGVDDGEISLTGPGLFLTDPVDTAGILAPGQYVLDAMLYANCEYMDCSASFEYDLILDGTRCAADIDRNGLVDWNDLLRVLGEWGRSVDPGACCLPDGTCADGVAYDDCLAAAGAPAGWGTRCDTDLCAPFVACCRFDGTCIMMTEAECLAECGTPQGAGSNCAEVTCP